ncbi:MAG: glycosyltransferase [Acidobacteria bacterium]|nr:glycosyltransferase [Acidobacteriota bacterium]
MPFRSHTILLSEGISAVVYWVVLLNKLIACYYALVLPVYAVIIVAALWSSYRHRQALKCRALQRVRESPLTPPVSILVPAYNEALSICESVRGLLQLDYPAIEIIVINDGSTDATLDALRREFGLVPTRLAWRKTLPCANVRCVYISPAERRLLVIDKVNGCKSDALNAGLNFATSPYFCTIDADVILESDALLRVMAPVLNERSLVLAAGGIVRVVNGCQVANGAVAEVRLPKRSIEVLQVIEYLRGFLFGREGWSALNALLIISGAFGVFSRRVALEIGGYRNDTVGEDMDLVVRMHRHLRSIRKPYRIVFVPDPVCWTQVPADLKTLVRQRARWHKGLLDVLWRSRCMFFNPRYGPAGMLAFPYQAAVELLGPIVEVIGIISLTLSGVLGIFRWGQLLSIALFAYLAGTILSVSAVLLEELTYRRYKTMGELFRLLAYTLFDFFPYRQFLIFCRIKGMVDYVRRPHQWGAQQRTGFKPAPAAR